MDKLNELIGTINLQEEERKRIIYDKANKSYDRSMFRVWLVWVSLFCGAGTVWLRNEGASVSGIILVLLIIVTATGGYVFGEVRRVHKRIDALVKLIEMSGVNLAVAPRASNPKTETRTDGGPAKPDHESGLDLTSDTPR